MIPISQKNSVLLVLILISNIAVACDFCSLLDYGNLTNQTSVRLDYRYRSFHGYNQNINYGQGIAARQGIGLHRSFPGSEKTYVNDPEDYELYTQINLGFIYNHQGRTNFILNIPYARNIDYYGLVIPEIGAGKTEKNYYAGIGDINLGIQKIYSKQNDVLKHTLKLSGLVHLPTGAYRVQDLFGENIHMQPGRAIYAGDLGAFYTFENIGSWGFILNSTLYLPVKNNALNRTFSYQFARKSTTDLQFFKIFEGEAKKVVFLGMKNEISGKEFINDFEIYDTGYQALFTSLGFTLKYKNSVLTASYDIPIYQKLNGLQLKTFRSFGLSLMHYLPKKESK